jgi:hypothetical protein
MLKELGQLSRVRSDKRSPMIARVGDKWKRVGVEVVEVVRAEVDGDDVGRSGRSEIGSDIECTGPPAVAEASRVELLHFSTAPEVAPERRLPSRADEREGMERLGGQSLVELRAKTQLAARSCDRVTDEEEVEMAGGCRRSGERPVSRPSGRVFERGERNLAGQE